MQGAGTEMRQALLESRVGGRPAVLVDRHERARPLLPQHQACRRRAPRRRRRGWRWRHWQRRRRKRRARSWRASSESLSLGLSCRSVIQVHLYQIKNCLACRLKEQRVREEEYTRLNERRVNADWLQRMRSAKLAELQVGRQPWLENSLLCTV